MNVPNSNARHISTMRQQSSTVRLLPPDRSPPSIFCSFVICPASPSSNISLYQLILDNGVRPIDATGDTNSVFARSISFSFVASSNTTATNRSPPRVVPHRHCRHTQCDCSFSQSSTYRSFSSSDALSAAMFTGSSSIGYCSPSSFFIHSTVVDRFQNHFRTTPCTSIGAITSPRGAQTIKPACR